MIVGEGNCNPTYFLDEMQWWEVNRYIAGNRRKERATMEAARLVGFWSLNAMGAKLHSLTDLITFPWEKEQPDTEPLPDNYVEEMQRLIREENERLQREQSQTSATANQSKPTA